MAWGLLLCLGCTMGLPAKEMLSPLFARPEVQFENFTKLFRVLQDSRITVAHDHYARFHSTLQDTFLNIHTQDSSVLAQKLIKSLNGIRANLVLDAVIDSDQETVSLLFDEQSPVIRFKSDGSGIRFVTLEETPRGTMSFPHQPFLMNVVASLVSIYSEFSREDGQITLKDINDHRLFLPLETRPGFTLSEDEMYFAMSLIHSRLDKIMGTRELQYARRPVLRTFQWNAREKPFDVVRNTRVRAVQHRDLFRHYNTHPDKNQLNVYLARDGLSAMEFHRYLDYFLGRPHVSRAMYQPGRPVDGRGSRYETTDSLEETLLILKRIYTRVIKEVSLRKEDLSRALEFDDKINDLRINQGTKNLVDETVFNEIEYVRFAKRFKQEYLNALNVPLNTGLRKELAGLWRQFRHVGIEDFPETKKILLVDLNATGKTIFYLKTALEILSEPEVLSLLKNEQGNPWPELTGVNAFSGRKWGRPFLGFGRGEQNMIPKLPHELGHSVNDFPDVNWSMEMADRNPATGEIYFRRNTFSDEPSATYAYGRHRFNILNQVYQSLLLFNEAYKHARAIEDHDREKPFDVLRTQTSEEIKDLDFEDVDFFLTGMGMAFPGYLGAQKEAFVQKMNAWYGAGEWQFAHILADGTVLTAEDVYALIERSYLEYFKSSIGADALNRLLHEAADIYVDDKPGQVRHGLDYLDYKASDYQFQATAIRRVVAYLKTLSPESSKFSWRGKRLIKLRGDRSEHHAVRAERIHFTRPSLITRTGDFDQVSNHFWRKNSIAHFFYATLIVMKTDDLTDVLQEQRLNGNVSSVGTFLRHKRAVAKESAAAA